MNMKLAAIKEILGQPFCENDSVLLYNMSCQEGLEQLLGNNIEIDATITSPPYNIGKEYEDVMALEDYLNWLELVSEQIFHLTKENGAYLLNIGYLKVENIGRAVPISYLIWDRVKFYLNQEIVWNYGAGVACKHYLSPRNEKVLWYVKSLDDYTFNLDNIRDPDVKYPNQKKNGILRCNTLGKNPSDVWQIAKVTSGKNRSSKERMNHPAQFPQDLIKRMVLGFTNEEDLILDPFIGSGTTAVTAMEHNRKCLGFEVDENYCKLIRDRLGNVQKQEEVKAISPELFEQPLA